MIEFVTAVIFGCFSAGAMDEVISESEEGVYTFDSTEMMEQIEENACFYAYIPDVEVEGVHKEFKWSDGDNMVVAKGKAPNGDSIYFWLPKDKYEMFRNKHLTKTSA